MEYFAFQQQPYIQLCLIIDDGLALKVSAENAWLSKWWILQMRMKISMWIFTWKIDRKWMFKWHCDNDELANVSVQDARMFEKSSRAESFIKPSHLPIDPDCYDRYSRWNSDSETNLPEQILPSGIFQLEEWYLEKLISVVAA